MQLNEFWFGLIAVLWTGYFFLEGFDFGVGMLLPVIGRTERDRSVVLSTIAPVWDGNEVWLITAGASMFAAFPEWYATLFSGFYLPLFLILVALIGRAIALEYRGKVDDDRWRSRWDIAIVVGSWVPAVLWGVAFANIVAGVPIDADRNFTGDLLTLLNPFGLLGGVTFAAVFALHGANFLTLKTFGEIHDRARAVVRPIGVVAIALGAVFLVVNQVARGKGWTWVPVLVAAVGLVGSVVVQRVGRDGWAFVLTGISIAAVVVALFGSLYPNVMPSTTDAAYDLTIDNASSTSYTLTVMTWVAGLMTPLVVGYQAWSYWVFRKRVGRPPVAATAAPST
ncbi:MAG: cytochrome d ubiquinol oxidase subunit II [Desertimonas sp.]